MGTGTRDNWYQEEGKHGDYTVGLSIYKRALCFLPNRGAMKSIAKEEGERRVAGEGEGIEKKTGFGAWGWDSILFVPSSVAYLLKRYFIFNCMYVCGYVNVSMSAYRLPEEARGLNSTGLNLVAIQHRYLKPICGLFCKSSTCSKLLSPVSGRECRNWEIVETPEKRWGIVDVQWGL